ncbi:MAG TPA: hypothetical protein VIJ25_11205 [Methylococcales bacterium]
MAAAKHKNADIAACMRDRKEIPTPISTFVGPADQMQPLLILYGLRLLPEMQHGGRETGSTYNLATE